MDAKNSNPLSYEFLNKYILIKLSKLNENCFIKCHVSDVAQKKSRKLWENLNKNFNVTGSEKCP